MLAQFFGLSLMTRIVTYIGAILGAIYAAEQVITGAKPLLAGWLQ